MQKIVPHLWFDKEAQQAAKLYTSLFEKSRAGDLTTLHDTPSGDAGMMTITLAGQDFMLINAGPYFKFNPSISFAVSCESKEEVDRLWGKLSEGSKVLMELGAYPFSEWYGWLQDKYGVSWQLMFMSGRKAKQKITPTLMFVGKQAGHAEEAIKMYTSIFHHSKMGDMMRYGKDQETEKPESLKYAAFTLEGFDFVAMDSSLKHEFSFNEAISFIVHCEDQQEIDYYWGKLSADPKSEQCGWLKDKFGVSWQIVPTIMGKMMGTKDQKKLARVTEAFLKMKKFDIAKLEEAFKG